MTVNINSSDNMTGFLFFERKEHNQILVIENKVSVQLNLLDFQGSRGLKIKSNIGRLKI